MLDRENLGPVCDGRRRFLQGALAVVAGLAAAPQLAHSAADRSFSFVLLGDLHFDKLEHHDFDWLNRHKPDDLAQIQSYSLNTAETTPHLFASVRQTVAESRASSQAPIDFVLQVGDLVEGLCGSEQLATQQNEEAAAWIRDAKWQVPFLFTKGNHDVTGDGAPAAFANVFHPFLKEQTAHFPGGGKLAKACYSVEHGNAQFCAFDAYDSESLDWLEATLAKRTVNHCFLAVHPPVVPYGARATWYLFSNAKDRAKREKLLELLGRENVMVLGGHLHRFSAIARTTPRGGRFAQVAVSSVITSLDVQPKHVLSGVESYNGDQIRVEPNYSPATADARRAVYDAERPFVKAFDFADHPGYAVVTVSADAVTMKVFSGVGRKQWTTVNLSQLLFG